MDVSKSRGAASNGTMHAIVILLILSAGLLSAQTRQNGAGGFRQRMDANGDGKFSREEFPGPKNFFDQFDKDKSGTIEKKELATLCIALNDPLSPPELQDFFKQVDKDNSGKITWQEFIDYWKSN